MQGKVRELWCLIVSPAPFAAPPSKWRFNRASKKVRCAFYVCIQQGILLPRNCLALLQFPLILALHIWMNAECRRRRRRIGCGLVHRFVVSLSLHPPNYPAWQWKSINLIWHLPRPTNQLPSPSTPPPKNLLPTFPSADSAHLPFACRWATIVILLSRLTKWHTLRFLMSRLCRIWEVVGFPSRMWVGYFMLKKIRDRFMLNM